MSTSSARTRCPCILLTSCSPCCGDSDPAGIGRPVILRPTSGGSAAACNVRTVETDPAPWIQALRHSHDVLRATAEPLTEDQLRQRSYASEWSIAQVLSHLGSQSEIFGLFLDAGLTGQDPPGMEQFVPIWDIWNAKGPQAQADDALLADEVITTRFESLTDDERARLRLNAFGRELDVAGVAAMRLSEHAVHTW